AGLAEFPDSVTARGAKHMEALGALVADGLRAVVFYVVQRQDCGRFRVAADIDPTYAAALRRARARGVEVLCYSCKLGRESIELDSPLALEP
ncbi:MAG: DNA/RNA nuclease SfsA, partial [Alphaproteobacteria bacterium]